PVPNAFKLILGQQIHFPQILMMPKGTVYGYVVDENGKAVECYVRTKHGKMVKTEDAAYLKEFDIKNLNYTPLLQSNYPKSAKKKTLKKSDMKMKMKYGVEKEVSDETTFMQMQTLQLAESGQKFTVKIPTGVADTLFVFPVDLKYFNDTIVIPALQNIPNDTTNYYLGKVVVKERKHRILIDVSNQYTKQPVANCRVRILDYEDTTDKNGIAIFEFKNASLKNFWMKIDPPDTSDLIPVNTEIQNEESKDFKEYNFTLKPGMTVKGKVTVKGNAVPYAEIYVLNGYNTNIRKTKSDANGDYILKGINPNLGWKKQNSWINVRCVPPEENPPVDSTGKVNLPGQLPGTVIDPNIDYPNLTGEEKKIEFDKGQSYEYSCNFELMEFAAANLQRLHGFHIKVHKIVSKLNGDYELNGLIDFSKSANAFELLDNSQYAGLGNLIVHPNNQNLDSKGRPYFEAVPGNTSFPLTLPTMKVRLKGISPPINSINLDWGNKTFNYNVLLSAAGQGNNYLNIIKESLIAGHLSSKARLVDNSFNFPGSYFRFQDDQFYLTELKGHTYEKIITSLEDCVDTSKFMIILTNNKKGKSYHLTNANGTNLLFNFLEFNAKSNISNSVLTSQGIIYLLPHAWSNIRLDPQNPTTTLVEVDIPQTSITSEGISCGGKIPKLEIKFEQWNVVAKNCEVSPDVGGVKSSDCMIETGALDIPIGEFNLRHDFLYIAKPNVSQLSLGGIWTMNVNNPQSAQFGLDPKCGIDLKPHYKLIFIGDPAATVQGLPGLATLKFQAVSLLSNGEQIVSFSPDCEKVALYDIANFKPLTIYSYADAFSIDGLMDFDIPRVPNGLTYKLKYTKPGANLVLNMLPTDITFDGPGYVKYASIANTNKQLISYRDLKLYGTISEPGKLNPIFIILNKHKTNTQTTITINRDPGVGDQFIELGGAQGGKFKVDSARMVVKNNDWDILRLKLYPVGSFSDKGFGNKPLNLAVFGEIKTDPDVKNQKITTSGTNTEFGDFTMTFDLPNQRFIGTLNISEKQIGTIKISGAAEICIDPHGFYFAAAAKAEVTPMGVFSAGILIGIYDAGGKLGGIPQATKDMVTSFSIGKGLPCTLENATTFAGFFVTGRKSIPQLTYNASVNLVIASAAVSIEAGVEASAWANFASPVGGGISVLLYAVAELEMGSITCTSLSAKAEAIVKGEAQWNEGQGIEFGLCASINIYGKLKQEIPTLWGCDGTIFELGSNTDPFISLKAQLTVGSGGLDASISTGSCNENCSSVVQ
ncbi:MAG: carboxypeptidase-like regulatory domain-containing protein, partial [Bacteroidetes bacterium]|nr:carboxypeptidase-like regulatory domain-containing protein [Bacteroidota bacterium]